MSTNTEQPVQDAPAEPEAVAPSEPQRSPTIAFNSKAGGIQFATLEDAYRFACYAVASGWAPKGMNAEGALLAMQCGAEVGLPPVQSLHGCAVINGTPSIFGKYKLGVCRSSSVFDHKRFKQWFEGEGPTRVAFCQGARIGDTDVTIRSFSDVDRKRAKLGNVHNTYPDRMLNWRATSYLLDDLYADVVGGMECREVAMEIERALDGVQTTDIPTTPSEIREGLSKPAEPDPNLANYAPDDGRASDPGERGDPELKKTRAKSDRDLMLSAIHKMKGDDQGQEAYIECLAELGLSEDELPRLTPVAKLTELLAVLQRKQLAATQAANGPTEGAAAAT